MQDTKRRFRVGQRVTLDGRKWRVGLVNSCRVRLDPLTRVERTIKGKKVRFLGTSINISPYSELEGK